MNHDVGGEPTIGIEGATDIAPAVDVGLHFTWLNLSGSANETVVAPKLELHPWDRQGPFVGVLTGLGITKHWEGEGSSVGFLAAPEVGYRIALPTDFTVGVNANWAFTTNSPNFLSVLLSFSYWL